MELFGGNNCSYDKGDGSQKMFIVPIGSSALNFNLGGLLLLYIGLGA